MSDAPALTVVSGSALYQAVLDSGGWSHRPKISKKLAKMGDRTRAMETTALRVPAWRTSPSAQLLLPFDEPVQVYGYPTVVEGNARAKDLPLLIGWASRYIAEGCPESRIVAWTLEEGADWLAYSNYGGRQMKLVKQAVRRIKSAVLEEVAVRVGPGEPTPLDHGYGFIEEYRINRGRGNGRAWVELNKTFADLLRLGRVTFLDDPIIRELQVKDEVALRIWLFLETESGPSQAGGWRYPVFPAPGASMPSIRQLAWLAGDRKKVVARIRRALKVLCEADPRYDVSVDRKGQMSAKRDAGKTYETGSNDPKARRTKQAPLDVRNGLFETYEAGSFHAHPNVEDVEDVEEDSSRGTNPLLQALRAKGWRRTEKIAVRVREVARHRNLGNDDDVARIIVDHYPGRDQQDLFVFFRQWRQPSRQLQLLDQIEAPPFCDGANCTDRTRPTIVLRDKLPFRALCEQCRKSEAA